MKTNWDTYLENQLKNPAIKQSFDMASKILNSSDKISNIIKQSQETIEDALVVNWDPRSFVMDFTKELVENATPKEIVSSFISLRPRLGDSIPSSLTSDIFEDKFYIGEAVDRAYSDLGLIDSDNPIWYKALPKSYLKILPEVIVRFWNKSAVKIAKELSKKLDNEEEIKDYILQIGKGDITLYTDQAQSDSLFK